MKVEVSCLPNGLTVATEVLPGIDSIAVDIWVNTGSRNEEKEENGLAHLLEHMAFKGTSRRNAFQIASEIETVGGSINAGTNIETTSFHTRLLSEHYALAVDILSDILQDPLFDSEELQREQHVILQEIGSEHDFPEEIAFTRFIETAFQHQPIGRPILGTQKTVQSFTAKDLHLFMEREYTAERMVVVGTGKIDHDAFVKEVEMKLGRFRTRNTEIPYTHAKAHYTGGDYRENRTLMDTQVLIGFEGKAYGMEDFHAVQILSIILGGNTTSRLFQQIRERYGLCYSIHSFHCGFIDTGLFGIHAVSDEKDLEQLISLTLEQLHHLCTNISEEEIQRVKTQYLASLIMSAESVTNRAEQIARQLLFFKRPIPRSEIFEKINSISSYDLKNLSQAIFSSPPVITAIGRFRSLGSYETIFRSLPKKIVQR